MEESPDPCSQDYICIYAVTVGCEIYSKVQGKSLMYSNSKSHSKSKARDWNKNTLPAELDTVN